MDSCLVTIEKDFLFIDISFYREIGDMDSTYEGSVDFDNKSGIEFIPLMNEKNYIAWKAENKPKHYFLFKIVDPQKFFLMRIEHGF